MNILFKDFKGDIGATSLRNIIMSFLSAIPPDHTVEDTQYKIIDMLTALIEIFIKKGIITAEDLNLLFKDSYDYKDIRLLEKIRYVKGDATQPLRSDKGDLILHVCNDEGKWGKGFVLAVSKRWSSPEVVYRQLMSSDNPSKLGDIQVVKVTEEDNLWVVNMIAQKGLASESNPIPLRYSALRDCLIKVYDLAMRYNYTVHMPRIGAGLARGDWKAIESLIEITLTLRGIKVIVYDLEK